MYKDFKTVLITGHTGTGKTTFIKKYINEIINEDCKIYIVDPKMVELFEYKDLFNVKYVNETADFNKDIFDEIKVSKGKKYLFIDEYAEVRFDKLCHENVKFLIKNRREIELEIILTSQLKTAFCNGMKSNVDTIIDLKRMY